MHGFEKDAGGTGFLSRRKIPLRLGQVGVVFHLAKMYSFALQERRTVALDEYDIVVDTAREGLQCCMGARVHACLKHRAPSKGDTTNLRWRFPSGGET